MKKVFFGSFVFLLCGCFLFFLFSKSSLPVSNENKEISPVVFSSSEEYIENMTLGEKIGQLLLVMAPAGDKISPIEQYHIGGYIYGGMEIRDQTKESLENEFSNYQIHSKVPLLFAIDEEGGTVTRVSYNSNLSSTFFDSPKNIYEKEGLEGIRKDTQVKSEILEELGFHLNLAPVADIATHEESFMWDRSFNPSSDLTSSFVETVIVESLKYPVSYTLKHFPGHGDNKDSHFELIFDTRSLEEYQSKDFLPFQAGIDAGAEFIMMDHVIMSCLDAENPASLSSQVIEYLRNQLHYNGIIITDSLGMLEIENKYVKAIQAGNTMLVVSDYQNAFEEIYQAVQNGFLDLEEIDMRVKKILDWKEKVGIIKAGKGS